MNEMTPLSDAIIDMIKREAARPGSNFRRVADRAGVSPGVLSRVVRRQRSMTLDTTDALLSALGFDVRIIRRKGT